MARLPHPEDIGRQLPSARPTAIRTPVAPSGASVLARHVGQAANTLDRMAEIKQQSTAKTWIAKTMAETRAKWVQEQIEREKNATDPANYARGMVKDFDEYARQTIANAPNKEAAEDIGLRLTDFASKLYGNAMLFENNLYTANAGTDIKQVQDTAANTLLSDPSQLDALRGDLAATIEAQRPYLGAAKVRDLALNGDRALVGASLSGRLEQGDYAGVRDELNSGRWDRTLDPKQKSALLSNIEKQEKLDFSNELQARLDAGDPAGALAMIEGPKGDLLSPSTRRVYKNFAQRQIGERSFEDFMANGGVLPEPDDVASAIDTAAAATGVDVKTLRTIAILESGMDPAAKNPRSTAGGLFQFVDKTARAYGLQDRYDPMQAASAAARLTRDNVATLTAALGQEPEPWQVYLAHQQGGKGAADLLTASPERLAVDVVGREAVILNGGYDGQSAKSFAEMWREKYEAASQMAGEAPASSSAPPGSEFWTSTQRRQAETMLQKRAEAEAEAIRLSHRLEDATNGVAPLVNAVDQDRKDRDAIWGVLYPQASNMSMEQLALAGTSFASQYGSVPEPVVDRLKQGLSATDNAVVGEAVNAVYAMAQPDPVVWDRIGAKPEAMARYAASLMRGGMAQEDAIKQAREAVNPQEPGVFEERKARLRAGGQQSALTTIRENVAEHFDVEGADADRILASAMPMIEASFMATGDAEAAQEQAISQLERVWGRSKVSGTELMRYPPERVFKVTGDDGEWMRRQLVEDVGDTLGLPRPPKDDGMSIGMMMSGPVAAGIGVADARDAREGLAERITLEPYILAGDVEPRGYYVFLDGEPLIDFGGSIGMEGTIGEGQLVVWVPDYSKTEMAAKARFDADAARKKRAEMLDAQKTEDELKARQRAVAEDVLGVPVVPQEEGVMH